MIDLPTLSSPRAVNRGKNMLGSGWTSCMKGAYMEEGREERKEAR